MHAFRLFFFPLLPILAFAADPPGMTAALANDLKHGGFVLFVRHPDASIGNDSAGPGEWWKDCAKQRVLSEAGKRDARSVGAELKRIGTPLVVVTSEYCRAIQSVELMGFDEYTVTAALNHLNAWPREALMEDGIREAMRGMLAAAPPRGSNTVLVGHVQNYPDPPDNILATMNMGDTAVFKPDGRGGFRLLAVVHPDGWKP
jgi:phosphohistidine phosphatase SixA